MLHKPQTCQALKAWQVFEFVALPRSFPYSFARLSRTIWKIGKNEG